MDTKPVLTVRETARVLKTYSARFDRDVNLSRAEFSARLRAISEELYPHKRYPGAK